MTALGYDARLRALRFLPVLVLALLSLTPGVADAATISDVRSDATSGAAARSVAISFASTTRQWVRVDAFDAAGALVREVAEVEARPGSTRVHWNGRDGSGARVADGRYRITVTSLAPGAEERIGMLVRVDGTPPRARLLRSRITPPHPKPRTVGIDLRLSEPAVVRIRTSGPGGSSTRTRRMQAGRHRFHAPVARPTPLHAALERGDVPIRLVVDATDDAGNRTTTASTLRLAAPGAATGDDPDPGREAMSWPLWGEISSYYGTNEGRNHTGLDIDTEAGVAIGATADGTVRASGARAGYGMTVTIDHGRGIRTLYAHQSRLVVRRGQRVLRGQLLGYVGSTGHSTGSHLHFEVTVRGKRQDPLRHLALGRAAMPASPAYF